MPLFHTPPISSPSYSTLQNLGSRDSLAVNRTTNELLYRLLRCYGRALKCIPTCTVHTHLIKLSSLSTEGNGKVKGQSTRLINCCVVSYCLAAAKQSCWSEELYCSSIWQDFIYYAQCICRHNSGLPSPSINDYNIQLIYPHSPVHYHPVYSQPSSIYPHNNHPLSPPADKDECVYYRVSCQQYASICGMEWHWLAPVSRSTLRCVCKIQSLS